MKQMDAAIQRVTKVEPLNGDRLVFLAGMRAAAQVKDVCRNIKMPTEFGLGWDSGHDEHQFAIRAEVKRLRAEMRKEVK